jgi:hypothetical protein
MLDSKKFIAIGFALCLIAACAYVFVFADAQFVDKPVQIDGYVGKSAGPDGPAAPAAPTAP